MNFPTPMGKTSCALGLSRVSCHVQAMVGKGKRRRNRELGSSYAKNQDERLEKQLLNARKRGISRTLQALGGLCGGARLGSLGRCSWLSRWMCCSTLRRMRAVLTTCCCCTTLLLLKDSWCSWGAHWLEIAVAFTNEPGGKISSWSVQQHST